MNVIYFSLVGLFFFNTPAYAYLDPGSVSIAIQAVIAAIAGGFATIRFWGHRLKEIFKRKLPQKNVDKKNDK